MGSYFGSDSAMIARGGINHRSLVPGREFTPDANSILPIASVGDRMKAYLVDMVVALVVYGLAMGLTNSSGIVLLVLSIHSYFLATELVFRRSVGKSLFGMKVVSADGSRASIGQILVRALCRPIDEMASGLIGVFLMRRSDETQRLGDLLADTVVIKR